MPHRPVLSDVPRGARVKGVAGAVKKITNHDQMTRAQRSHTNLWLPTGQDYLIASATGQTAGLAAAFGAPTGKVPPNAVAFHLLVSINANTVTGGVVRVHVMRDRNGTAFNDAALLAHCPMFAAVYTARHSGMAPIVDGGIYWAVTVANAVNYDVQIYVVGYVLE